MPDFSLDVGAQMCTVSCYTKHGLQSWMASWLLRSQRAATAFYLSPTRTIERDSFEDHGCPLARLGLEAGKL